MAKPPVKRKIWQGGTPLLRGIYAAASGMMAQEVKQNVLADNLSNMSTPGFRAGEVTQSEFPEQFLQTLGPISTGTVVDAVVRSKQPGQFIPSQAPLSAAIDGQGYFAVQTANGTRFTRDGEFRLNAQGTLVTLDGHAVLGQSGLIQGSPGRNDLRVTPSGNVYQGTNQIGTLHVVAPRSGTQMVQQAGNLLQLVSAPGGQPVSTAALPNATATLTPNMVESSDVNAVQAMSNLMLIARAYQASQRAFHTEDQALQTAVTEVGRV